MSGEGGERASASGADADADAVEAVSGSGVGTGRGDRVLRRERLLREGVSEWEEEGAGREEEGEEEEARKGAEGPEGGDGGGIVKNVKWAEDDREQDSCRLT